MVSTFYQGSEMKQHVCTINQADSRRSPKKMTPFVSDVSGVLPVYGHAGVTRACLFALTPINPHISHIVKRHRHAG